MARGRLDPLVTVVTNTYFRHHTLSQRLIPAIKLQTHNNIEHLIVSDGPDSQLRNVVLDAYRDQKDYRDRPVLTRVHHLGFNTSGVMPDSFGIAPLQVGCWLARGRYIVCIPDDDIMTSTHIADCVSYLEDEPDIGFVYTGFKQRTANNEAIIQSTEPNAGVIASPLFRRELLEISTWQMGDGLTADYKLVKRWIDAGIEYGFIDTPTFEHFADHPIFDVLRSARSTQTDV